MKPTETVEADRQPTPPPPAEPVNPTETVDAERAPTPEPAKVEETQQTSGVEQVPLDDDDDFIQAVRVPTPKFFPEKPASTSDSKPLEPETVSQKSRKGSTASQKSKTKLNTPSSKKNMNKFDMNMGLKDKKKPSTMRKFINMCTGKATTAQDNIEEKPKDPQ